jgi:hypothetical protein
VALQCAEKLIPLFFICASLQRRELLTPATATPSPHECQNQAFAGTPIRRSLPSQIAQRRRNSGALVLGTPAARKPSADHPSNRKSGACWGPRQSGCALFSDRFGTTKDRALLLVSPGESFSANCLATAEPDPAQSSILQTNTDIPPEQRTAAFGQDSDGCNCGSADNPHHP